MRASGRPLRIGTLSIAAALLGAVPCWAEDTASAQPEAAQRLKVCISSHEQAQVSRNEGDLLAARTAAVACSQAECPGIVRSDCLRWFDALDRDVPSAVIQVRSGELDVPARLSVDGMPRSAESLGRPLELNPGRHSFRVEPRGAPAQEHEIVLAPGEKARPIRFEVTLAQPESSLAAPGTRRARPIPAATWMLGGTALAFAASGAVLGSWALSDRAAQSRSLRDGGCSPYCTDHEVAAIQNKAMVADVFFGLSAVAGAAAVLAYVWRPEVPVTAGEVQPRWSVSASREAAWLDVRGSFR